MGKESIDSRRFKFDRNVSMTIISHRMTSKCLLNSWCSGKGAILKEDLHEDGRVTLRILSPLNKAVIEYGGLSPKGNTYMNLLTSLRINDIIKINERVEQILCYNDPTWNSVDYFTDTFNSGDRIMIITAINGKRKKKPRNKTVLVVRKSLRKLKIKLIKSV